MHCPHDGVQNPCPSCCRYPKVIGKMKTYQDYQDDFSIKSDSELEVLCRNLPISNLLSGGRYSMIHTICESRIMNDLIALNLFKIDLDTVKEAPNYCEDEALAMAALKKFSANPNIVFTLAQSLNPRGWHCEIGNPDEQVSVWSPFLAYSISRAICVLV